MGREFVKIDHSAAGLLQEGKGQGLKNSMVFTWGFVEMVLWFWVGLPFLFPFLFFKKNKKNPPREGKERSKGGMGVRRAKMPRAVWEGRTGGEGDGVGGV